MLAAAAVPGIKPGVDIGKVNLVDIYPFTAALLNVKPAKSDGSIAPFCDALRNRPEECGVAGSNGSYSLRWFLAHNSASSDARFAASSER
jgi:hypothetical protein